MALILGGKLLLSIPNYNTLIERAEGGSYTVRSNAENIKNAFVLGHGDTNNQPIGVYIHVPFCNGKCPYCDFYSLKGTEEMFEAYAVCVEKAAGKKLSLLSRPVDTVYFGGGTPNLLGGERLLRILEVIKPYLVKGAEITVEVNPAENLAPLFRKLFSAGVSRLSIGMQSCDEEELHLLGRRHGAAEVEGAVYEAREAGFQNLSLDLMMALPGQSWEALRRSIRFCASLGVEHISAYLLKIEEGTPFWRRRGELVIPEEEACRLYLSACRELEELGYRQYEISNFARPGFEGKHNLKYWHCEEYLGVGPAAHSFIEGKRFYFPRDINAFLREEPPCEDGLGGTLEEYCMLALRLTEGLSEEKFYKRYKTMIPEGFWGKARLLEKAGLCCIQEEGGRALRLTPEGFLVSNSIIGTLIELLDEKQIVFSLL